MFAYVSFKDGKRDIVPTKDIRNFDETSFNKKQLYNIRWTDGYFYEGAIAFVGETKSEVQEKVAAKRLNVFPINNCFSASELSDCDDSEKNIRGKKTKESNENILHLKVENLKRKQMEEKKKNDSRKKMKPSNLNSPSEELKQKLDNKENEDVGSKEKKYQYFDRAEKIEIEKCNDKGKEENVGSKEKKCSDSTTEKMRAISKKEYDEIKDKCKRLRNRNDILEKLLKERDEEIIKLKEARENERDLLLKCTTTSTELQSKVINRFSEITDIKNLVALLSLCYLDTVVTVARRSGNGNRNRTWRPPHAEIQEGVISHIEYWKTSNIYARKKKKADQLGHYCTYVLVCGSSMNNIDACYVILDTETQFLVQSPVRALDLCFKIIHAAHLEYYPESYRLWRLIQKELYELTTEFDEWKSDAQLPKLFKKFPRK